MLDHTGLDVRVCKRTGGERSFVASNGNKVEKYFNIVSISGALTVWMTECNLGRQHMCEGHIKQFSISLQHKTAELSTEISNFSNITSNNPCETCKVLLVAIYRN